MNLYRMLAFLPSKSDIWVSVLGPTVASTGTEISLVAPFDRTRYVFMGIFGLGRFLAIIIT